VKGLSLFPIEASVDTLDGGRLEYSAPSLNLTLNEVGLTPAPETPQNNPRLMVTFLNGMSAVSPVGTKLLAAPLMLVSQPCKTFCIDNSPEKDVSAVFMKETQYLRFGLSTRVGTLLDDGGPALATLTRGAMTGIRDARLLMLLFLPFMIQLVKIGRKV